VRGRVCNVGSGCSSILERSERTEGGRGMCSEMCSALFCSFSQFPSVVGVACRKLSSRLYEQDTKGQMHTCANSTCVSGHRERPLHQGPFMAPCRTLELQCRLKLSLMIPEVMVSLFFFQFQHLGGAFEDGNGRRRLRQHCIGFERMMSAHSAPCR
jgi:hypothetical protein